ncbi:MAG: pyrroline-5-carboxylate reductase [Caulobacteraceae bacterium]
MDSAALPILIVGAGHMGGALIAGWRLAGVAATDLIILDPAPGPAALAAVSAGARLDPPPSAWGEAASVILALKPQAWRPAVADLASHLTVDAKVISIMAGVKAEAISGALGGRPATRVMPTTAAAMGRGAAAIWSPDGEGRARAHALFAPLATVVDLEDEDLIHVATAASGSAPAYLYAFVEALAAAAVSAGLPAAAASRLARATVTGAAALLATSDETPRVLRDQVTSPGGTTAAALAVLMAGDGLAPLMERAVSAAVARSRELGA